MIWIPKISNWEQNQLKISVNFMNSKMRMTKLKIKWTKVLCKMIYKNRNAQMITKNPNNFYRMLDLWNCWIKMNNNLKVRTEIQNRELVNMTIKI